MRADGSGVRRLSNYDGAAGTPAWAPNGKSVVFYAAEAREILPLASGAKSAGTTQIIEFVLEAGVSISRTTGMGAQLFPQWRGAEFAYYDRSGQGALRLEDGVAAGFGEFHAPTGAPTVRDSFSTARPAASRRRSSARSAASRSSRCFEPELSRSTRPTAVGSRSLTRLASSRAMEFGS